MLENALEGNVIALAATGAAALVLPVLFPRLASPLRAVVKSGATLFLEAETEAEGGLIGRVADAAVKALLDSVAAPGGREQRQLGAQAAVRRFEATARARAQRFGWNEEDAAARYRRHVAHFRRALATAQESQPARRREMLNNVAGTLSEDW